MTETRSENYLYILRTQMADAYDMEGLQVLAFDLRLDWDELAGETKSAKIVSLLIVIGEYNRLSELLDILKDYGFP